MPTDAAALDAAIEAVRSQHADASSLPPGHVGGFADSIKAILDNPAFKQIFSMVLTELAKQLSGGGLMRAPASDATPEA